MPLVHPAVDLAELSTLAERLNASTDSLNAELKAIEDRLNALSLGVEAWVTSKPLQEEFSSSRTVLTQNALVNSSALGATTRTRTAIELGYARFPDGWKLAIRTVDYRQMKDRLEPEWSDPVGLFDGRIEVRRDAKPLLRASRTVRTLAVDLVPDLIETLYIAGTSVADAVEKARSISDSLR
jgi:hypothetical protein